MTMPAPPSTYILKAWDDVGLPDTVNWLPQTLGWKILGLLLLAALLSWLSQTARHWWLNRYRREACQVVCRLKAVDSGFEYQLFVILKRVLSYLNPKDNALFGEDFLQRLDAYEPNADHHFSSPLGNRWLESLHTAQCRLSPDEQEQLRARCLDWLNRHRPDPAQAEQP